MRLSQQLRSTRPTRTLRGCGLAAVALLIGLSATPLSLAADPATEAVSQLARDNGLTGDDLSSATVRSLAELPAALRERPRTSTPAEWTHEDPAVRVHVTPSALARLEDRDFDGIPDRASAALRVAVRALSICRNEGFGEPADDGDGEIDVYLTDFDGLTRGYAILERPAPPGRGASGFVVVDASPAQDSRSFLGMVARGVARLVLAGRDAQAPAWWVEPTAIWLEARVTGPPRGLRQSLDARWNHAERGITTSDPVLARGNVALPWSIAGTERTDLDAQLLSTSWQRLAERDAETTAYEAVDAAARETTGLDLLALQERAAAVRLATESDPGRWGLELTDTLSDTRAELPVAPSGLAIIELTPGRTLASGAESSVLTLRAFDEGPWRATLLAERLRGSWERTRLQPTHPDAIDARFEVEVPWRDYRRAVVFFSRSESAPGSGAYTAAVSPGAPEGPYALSNLSATAVGDHRVELRWRTTREQGLFGWIVERASALDGPWTALDSHPIPSFGTPRDGSTYTFLDEAVVPGRDAYYRVVAVTSQGLRVSGPPVAVAR